jgi:silicon transporter|eukprot:scaffold10534_cov246-Chaetoceros_neogracile.AAC.4
MNVLNAIKGTYSSVLLVFSIVIIMGLIATSQTNLSEDTHPAVAYVLIWVAIGWLTMVEGGQASLVGLAPVNPELYRDSHPIAYKCTKITNKGDNLDRYLLGRQFMVVIMVFTVNMSGGPLENAELWGFPSWLSGIFLQSGLAMILFTCNVGQLNTQVNASLCMLDYIDSYFGLFTLWVSMAIEFSGLLHSSYLVQMLVAKLAGKSIESNEDPRNAGENIFFYGRCFASLAILIGCFAVTLEALFKDQTTMWEGVPAWLAVLVFFFLMSVVGMLEGMQIAFFAVAKLPASERGDSVWALKTCNLLFKGEGNNLPGFMIGRQLCVVSCMFFVARVTSVSVGDQGNIFGVSDGLQELFNTGLLGALITTICASISWQLVASAFPMAFLSNPITYFLLRLCLILEATGLCGAAWLIAGVVKKITGLQRDEYYIGTAEERAKGDMGDDTTHLPVGAGHIAKLPGFASNAPRSLKKLMNNDPSVAQYLNSHIDEMESQKASKAARVSEVKPVENEEAAEATAEENAACDASSFCGVGY